MIKIKMQYAGFIEMGKKKAMRALNSNYVNGNLVKSKRSQLRIQQMSFMLLAVVLFFILVGLFYVGVRMRGLRDSAEDLTQQKTISTISIIAETAEFECGEGLGEAVLCIDSDKLIVMLNKEGYRSLWPSDIESLKVVKIFPKTEEEIECNKNNYPDCNSFEIFDGGGSQVYISSFAALCRKDLKNDYSYDKCEIAKIIGGVKKND